MTSAPTQETTTRMRAGQHRARILLGADADPGATATEAWGWQGRTLGTSVIANDQTAWLRLASDPHHYSTFWWDGPSQATTLPRALPRPRLHATCSWTDDHWRYRAELFDRAPNAISPTLVITHDPDLPAAWWEQLRDALHTLANTPTPRIAVQQQYLDHAMPRLLGTPINTRSLAPWTTCHGDLHFANLIGPDLLMLDWEGWGMAPAGYDAARLHATCLLRPRTRGTRGIPRYPSRPARGTRRHHRTPPQPSLRHRHGTHRSPAKPSRPGPRTPRSHPRLAHGAAPSTRPSPK